MGFFYTKLMRDGVARIRHHSMRDKRLIIISVVAAIALFLIEANLGMLLNLVSADLDQWYSQNRNLVLGLTVVFVVVGAILVAINVRLSSIKETETMPESANPVDATMVLQVIYEEFRTSPGEKIHFESIRQKLGLSEQELVYLVKKLEERGFVHATWIGRKALLAITENGVSLLRDN